MMLTRMLNTPWGWGSPLDDLEHLKRNLGRFSEELGKGLSRGRWAGVFPLINLTETKEDYRVRAELPGLTSEDLDISVTGNSLAISGERKIVPANKTAKYHRREREPGKFSRIITLPGHVDNSKVEARFKDGILTVILPKAESAKPRRITVG